MSELNKNFARLQTNYLFSEITKRVSEYKSRRPTRRPPETATRPTRRPPETPRPDTKIINLGIGDVTQPIVPCVIAAMQAAVSEMGSIKTFRGYPPENGYPFLKEAIINHYKKVGVSLNEDEIFVDGGAKSSLGGLTDIFGGVTALITDPVYPAYADGNIIAGNKIEYLPASVKNNFLPMPDEVNEIKPYIIYLCSPNNPTGAVYSRQQLTEWVQFAAKSDSVIIFDSAYSAFVADGFPKSIFEIQGAEDVAAEVNSLSKSCGFTNLRCSWTVIKNAELKSLWRRRQSAKFNGVSYIIQRGAAAALSAEGQRQCGRQIVRYKQNAKLLAEFLAGKKMTFYGGIHSPYIWLRCPEGKLSWEYFDELLNNHQIVVTAGAGFGANGENFVRLSSFAKRADILSAIQRLNAAP
jgi:LL-diaminopimelate aminotransferase